MKAIENLKSYFKSVNDRRFLEKFEKNPQHFFRVGYDERVRWFEMVGPKERREALKKGYIDGGTCQRLFPKYANLVAPYMCLTDKQFELILQEGYTEALEGYLKRTTLSVPKIRSFIDATVLRAGQNAQTPISESAKRLPDLLYRYIVREGIPTDLCSVVADLPDGTIKKKIADAIDVRYHIAAVKQGYNKELATVTNQFETYLLWMKKESIRMPYEAEVLMNARQLHSFYSYGHHLSKKAIVAFFANYGIYDEVLDLIIGNEVLYPAWPELEYTFKSARPNVSYNVLVYEKYQSALCVGKLKKANS